VRPADRLNQSSRKDFNRNLPHEDESHDISAKHHRRQAKRGREYRRQVKGLQQQLDERINWQKKLVGHRKGTTNEISGNNNTGGSSNSRKFGPSYGGPSANYAYWRNSFSSSCAPGTNDVSTIESQMFLRNILKCQKYYLTFFVPYVTASSNVITKQLTTVF
jgi:hypothetical protein